MNWTEITEKGDRIAKDWFDKTIAKYWEDAHSERVNRLNK